MSQIGPRAVAFGFLLLAGCSNGCGGCTDAPIATLRSLQGDVVRDFASAKEDWVPAKVGDSFNIEDGIRTQDKSTAALRLASGSDLALKPRTLIRFLASLPEEPDRLEMETGEAEIASGSEDIVLQTTAGPARLSGGSKVRIVRRGGKNYFEVLVGRALIEEGDHSVIVQAGNRVVVALGRAIIEPKADVLPVADVPVETATATPAANEPNPAAAVTPAVDRIAVHVVATSGETAWIHDVQSGTGLRFPPEPQCPNGTKLDLFKNKIRGRPFQSVSSKLALDVRVPPGRYAYRIRCANNGRATASDVSIEGRLVVVRDAGRRRLPRKPPKNTIDADGRSYRILYQNYLPEIRIEWTKALKASGYRFELERVTSSGRSSAKSYSAKRPWRRFRSGTVPEGRYRFRVVTADGRGLSPWTKLFVEFDNATPTAYLQHPASRTIERGVPTRITGAAMLGSEVSVAGKTFPVDDKGRFDFEVTPEGDGLGVRIAHPVRGIHYYVRRVR